MKAGNAMEQSSLQGWQGWPGWLAWFGLVSQGRLGIIVRTARPGEPVCRCRSVCSASLAEVEIALKDILVFLQFPP